MFNHFLLWDDSVICMVIFLWSCWLSGGLSWGGQNVPAPGGELQRIGPGKAVWPSFRGSLRPYPPSVRWKDIRDWSVAIFCRLCGQTGKPTGIACPSCSRPQGCPQQTTSHLFRTVSIVSSLLAVAPSADYRSIQSCRCGCFSPDPLDLDSEMLTHSALCWCLGLWGKEL